MFLTETPPDAVGEARAHEQQFLQRLNEEVRSFYLYFSGKLHCKIIEFRKLHFKGVKEWLATSQDLLICSPLDESDISTKRAFGFCLFSVRRCLMRAAASGSLATM